MKDLGELFTAQVGSRPDAIAVESPTCSLTYRELHDRAAAVAAGLAGLGVRRETLVGTSFERSADAVVAMLGVVLAGGAYVPLNPAFPGARLAELIDDSGVAIVLCDGAGADVIRVVAPPSTLVCALDDVATTPAVTLTPAAVWPSPLAYVMYTSGSTGGPRGVLVEHRGVIRLAADPEYVEIFSDDRILQMSALEFDASTWEVWAALLNGARLCIVDTATALVPWRLRECITRYGATMAWVTSARLNQLVDEDPGIFAPPLRVLLAGGDVLSPRHVRTLLAARPDLELHNGYGPTENTTFTTTHQIRMDCAEPIPIGRPIRGTSVLVLDEQRRPVPATVMGELYVGGDGVARGYLNREELTRERFVVLGGERFYRTGDLVHESADGVLHFHGRADGQVKIRGHRVELGEVTAVLRAVPGVSDCHVRATGAAGLKRLTAYVAGTDQSAAQVRAVLAARVPRHLVPDQIVMVPGLPLNANGKVDLAALQLPNGTGGGNGSERPPQQRELAQLWADVLHIDADTIDPEESFFEAGGDSLSLGALVGRVNHGLRKSLTFAGAFASPTLAAMSLAVAAAAPFAAARIPRVPDGTPVDLHPQQVCMYALWQVDPRSLAYNVPAVVTVRGPLDPARLRAAFAELVARHDALRMRFLLTDAGVRQLAEPVTAELGLGSAADAAAFVRPFALDRPPLIRGLLVADRPGLHHLHLDAHHIVVDGISLRVLVDELFQLYGGADLGPPAVSYSSAAQWSHNAQPDRASEAYWLSELAGAPSGIDLLTDRPRGVHRAVRGAVAHRSLCADRTRELDALTGGLGTTPFAVLLAAYVGTLARAGGQHDIVVGTPMNGRGRPELESVVGMFVSTVCLRARIGATTTLRGLAAQLAAKQIDAMTHQCYPFDRLVHRLGGPRDRSRNPVFDTFFAYQRLGFAEITPAGLDVSVELRNPGTTRFDLNLQVFRRPDGLAMQLEYASELYAPDSADHLLDRFVTTLTELTERPDDPVLGRTADAPVVSVADFRF
ncbi:non-ribosomal peptide synthetase [Pseudonocardia sp. TRM90224]|uniref:non-ribosomal peptide synthetase n=1 Tax=Pseudonocardia sp. TRM90224 TaxID=2812678 RepID=UPI001E58E082|nr:non-ribosomal peptide synthetase [Pseudonocardia sp. TRM90224]